MIYNNWQTLFNCINQSIWVILFIVGIKRMRSKILCFKYCILRVLQHLRCIISVFFFKNQIAQANQQRIFISLFFFFYFTHPPVVKKEKKFFFLILSFVEEISNTPPTSKLYLNNFHKNLFTENIYICRFTQTSIIYIYL